jgi:hypothetical protein
MFMDIDYELLATPPSTHPHTHTHIETLHSQSYTYACPT